MKYSEAVKQIEELSSKYRVYMSDENFTITYKNMIVAWVVNKQRYLFYNNEDHFNKLPFSDKLYIILAELAITPLDKREEEKKYYVKIFDGGLGYLNIDISNGNMTTDGVYETGTVKTEFTDKEIEQLKQRNDIPVDWNKVKLEETNEN